MTTPPLAVARVLDRALDRRPDAEAVVGRSGVLSYLELDQAADAIAAGLWDLGVRRGDRVAASLPNDLDVIVAFHAVMRLGGIWVGVPTALAVPERQHILRDCQPRLYVHEPRDLAATAAAAASDAQGTAIGAESLLWRQWLGAGGRPPSIDIYPHAAAGIAYTSGTTGLPKGLVHSQHNLLLPGAVLTATRQYGPDLRKGDCLPLTILNLLVLTTLLTAQAGGCCVVMDRRDTIGIVEWVNAQQITLWNGVPTQLRDLVRRADIESTDLRPLSEVWCGGADLPETLRTEFYAKFGLPIRATYGLTEAPAVVAIDPPGRRQRAGSSGQVLPHLHVATRGGELTLAAAQNGPWAHRYTPPLGHWQADGPIPVATPLHTGDLGSVDADGWIQITGRSKQMIVRGGANVYPIEVEHVIKSVVGVAEAVVFGTPDDRLGERVTAIVEFDPETPTTPAAQHLRNHCATRLAGYKVPDTWYSIESLPRNAMGKVIRTGLASLSTSATRLECHAHD